MLHQIFYLMRSGLQTVNYIVVKQTSTSFVQRAIFYKRLIQVIRKIGKLF